MAQQDYSTKRRKFQHLTEEKRAQIEILLQMKVSKSRIAREVGIAHSTLYNELARGSVEQLDTHLRTYKRYFRDAGQCVYEERRRNSCPPLKLAKAYDFIAYFPKAALWTASPSTLSRKSKTGSTVSREKLRIMPPPDSLFRIVLFDVAI